MVFAYPVCRTADSGADTSDRSFSGVLVFATGRAAVLLNGHVLEQRELVEHFARSHDHRSERVLRKHHR